ncbi:hypothetical protein BJI47_09810 [Rhodococcus sp. 1168]|nr:hypothetical protein BJI47_09810 [Rhodococcus sp. 1168]
MPRPAPRESHGPSTVNDLQSLLCHRLLHKHPFKLDEFSWVNHPGKSGDFLVCKLRDALSSVFTVIERFEFGWWDVPAVLV